MYRAITRLVSGSTFHLRAITSSKGQTGICPPHFYWNTPQGTRSPQFPLSERFFHDPGKLVGIHAHLVRILPFNHDPAQRLRARIAQQHASTAFKPSSIRAMASAISEFSSKGTLCSTCTFPKLLRVGNEQPGKFGQGAPLLAHDPQDLEGGEEAVSGRAVFTENEMAGLFPAKKGPLLAHGRPRHGGRPRWCG